MHFHIITLHPDALESYLGSSIIGRAIKEGAIKVSVYNPRNFTNDKHHRVDQKPYGGGPGMVLEAQPVLKAIDKAVGNKKNVKKIFFAVDGKQFDNVYARKIAKKHKHVVLIAGHYEGIDARVQKITKAEPVSIGPYILTGGELPALVVLDVMARQIPGVLGNLESLEEERVVSSEVYTRPEEMVYQKRRYRVPNVLLSGHHQNIEAWKRGRKHKGKQR